MIQPGSESIPLRTDYMRAAGSLLADLGDPKTSQVWKYFLHFITQQCTRSIKELSADKRFYRLVLQLQLSECFIFEYISFSIGPPQTAVIYGSRRWTGEVWRSEPVHLGEPVRNHIISFIVESISFIVNQFLSYNRLLRHIFYTHFL